MLEQKREVCVRVCVCVFGSSWPPAAHPASEPHGPGLWERQVISHLLGVFCGAENEQSILCRRQHGYLISKNANAMSKIVENPLKLEDILHIWNSYGVTTCGRMIKLYVTLLQWLNFALGSILIIFPSQVLLLTIKNVPSTLRWGDPRRLFT
jgi:hypothetical protein